MVERLFLIVGAGRKWKPAVQQAVEAVESTKKPVGMLPASMKTVASQK